MCTFFPTAFLEIAVDQPLLPLPVGICVIVLYMCELKLCQEYLIGLFSTFTFIINLQINLGRSTCIFVVKLLSQ